MFYECMFCEYWELTFIISKIYSRNVRLNMLFQADELDEEVRVLTDKEGVSDSIKKDTVDLVHPNEVLKGLRAFVEDNRKPIK